VVIVVERMREDLVAEVTAVPLELAVGQRLVAAHELAGCAAARPALAQAVLHRLHLHVVPVRPEGAEDAAMVRHVAVPVGRAFPDDHRGQVRRLERRDVPLVDAVVRDAAQTHLAVRPGLHARPFDAVVEVPRLARRKVIDVPGRAASAARIDPHADVALRHPLLGIDHLPALVDVARAVRDVRVLGDHALPRARIAVLEREALGVGPVAQDDRIAPLGRRPLIWPIDVGAQHQAVVHGDRDVVIDAHHSSSGAF
jgi:hypothetical protein